MSFRDFLALAGDHLWQSTLFAAVAALVAFMLRRQLKLEAARAPVDVLVIDSVEKPTAN